MSTSSNKQPKKGEDGMGKAGKRKEMVEDWCVQEMHVEGRCVKEFRVKVLLVKEVVCVCVNSCALRTSQAPISFVSVIPAGVFQLPSSMLLEQTIEFARRQSAKKTAKVSKRMMFSETHVLPMTVCLSGSRISKKWVQFSIIHAYSACIHVM